MQQLDALSCSTFGRITTGGNVFQGDYQSFVDRDTQSFPHLRQGSPSCECYLVELEGAADTGSSGQDGTGVLRQGFKSQIQQGENVFGDRLLLDRRQIPGPSRLAMVIGNQALVAEQMQELDQIERIAPALAMQDLG